jgi:hypothetical protein
MGERGKERGEWEVDKNKLKPVFRNTESTVMISIIIYLYRNSHTAVRRGQLHALSFIRT